MAELKRLKFGGNYYYFNTPPAHVESISLNKNSIKFTNIGQTEQLIATVSPEGAVESKVIWSSSDTSVAFVNDDGLVTSIGEGTATITATVGNLSETCSVLCIDGIVVDFLLIGGGGSGGGGSCACTYHGGGGGAGGVIYCTDYKLEQGSYNVIIGGCGGCQGYNTDGNMGGDSCFGGYVAYGGGGGGRGKGCGGLSGGSGGGEGGNWHVDGGGAGVTGQGNNGGNGEIGCNQTAGGGGGYGSAGYTPNGGDGLCTDITGHTECFAGGGGGGGRYGGGTSSYGGGTGATCAGWGGNATTCGSGGGGGGNNSGCGACGVFIIRYVCGVYDITGGDCCYNCDGYTIHCFTSNGTLTVN